MRHSINKNLMLLYDGKYPNNVDILLQMFLSKAKQDPDVGSEVKKENYG